MKKLVPIIGWVVLGLMLPPSAFPDEAPQTKLFEARDIAFINTNIHLNATLLLPQVTGKVPGVVVIHGSGTSDRSNPWTTAYAEALANRGIAVLYPDKRGCGQSSGDWRSSTIRDFADDACAAVDALRKQPEIDPERLGLIGFSQGGDILPLAASLDPHVFFTIDISGSVVPMAEQIADEVELNALKAGCSQAQIRLLLQLNEQGLRFAKSGLETDWEDYEHALLQAKQGELHGSAILERFPARRDHPALGQVRQILSYDPMPFWNQVTVPKLFIYSGNDTQVRADKSLRRLQAELKHDNNYSVLFFNPNGHALFREDLCDFLARWIKEAGKP